VELTNVAVARYRSAVEERNGRYEASEGLVGSHIELYGKESEIALGLTGDRETLENRSIKQPGE
jgi:hypothetical protein